jgi:phosphinothricin acetyltransferase
MSAADWPEVNRIFQEGIATNMATFTPKNPTWQEWDTTHLKTCRIVICMNGATVGWAALSAVSNCCDYAGVAEISIYIGQEARGLGVGKRLLTGLIDCSEKHGFWTLQSDIMQDNSASIRLHEACGFRVVGYREKIGCDRFGNWRNTLLMERRSPREDFNTPCGHVASRD